MTWARTLQKLRAYQGENALQEAYDNERLPIDVDTIGEVLDYIINALYPNYVATVDEVTDLPLTANNGDYYIVRDDGDGNMAGYVWETRDGVTGFQKKFDVDWSVDGILADLEGRIAPYYVQLLGKAGGQRIAGGNVAGNNLELEANSVDDSGEIIVHNPVIPNGDAEESLGKAGKRFLDVFLSGVLSNGTDTVTVAQLLAAYTHSQATGNPHGSEYEDIANRLGDLDIDGDVEDASVDLSTAGNKSVTLTVKDNSHNHLAANITDLSDAVYALFKLILQDSDDLQWTFDDLNQEVVADINIDTGNLDDVAAPAPNKILVGNPDGDEWVQSDGLIELTGDISGSATYDSTEDKWEIETQVENTPLDTVDRIDLTNRAVESTPGNPTVLTLIGHKLTTGKKIRLFDVTFAGVYVVTRIDDDNFSIPFDSSLGAVENGYFIPEAANLLYDPDTDTFKVRAEFEEISHHEITDNDDDVHPQYALLDGRGNEQVLSGGETASGNLILQSTSFRASPGDVLLRDRLAAETGAVYSGGWQGTDLGSSGRPFRDIHTKGELKGGRVEQVNSLPSVSATERGRLVQDTDGDLWINTGTEWAKMAVVADGIEQLTAQIANNVGSPTNITGFTLDAAQYSSAMYFLEFYRHTSTTHAFANGMVALQRVNGAWRVVCGLFIGDSDAIPSGGGITLSVDETGGVAQVKYTTNNMSGASADGEVKIQRMVFNV